MPGAYITALLVAPTFTGALVLAGVLNLPGIVTAPVPLLPVTSRYHMVSEEMPNTLPFGATQARGYEARR